MTEKFPSVSVILLAAGKGKRAGFGLPKQFVEIAGKPLYRHSLDFFLKLNFVREIVLVVPRKFAASVKTRKKVKIASGGKRRQDSVRNALEKLDTASQVVLVHDSARPFVSRKIVGVLTKAAAKWGAAVPGTPVENTIKEIDGNFVKRTLERKKLFAVSTPQAFRTEFLNRMKNALSSGKNYTDDVSVLEDMGVPVRFVRMKKMNMKITTKEDVEFVNYLLNSKKREN